MALNWLWKDKCGEMVFEFTRPSGEVTEKKVNLYSGNALLIAIYQYEEDGEELWSMDSFFVDKEHGKRCLGLDKSYESGNMYNTSYQKLVKLRLDKSKCRKSDFNTIVRLFTDAFEELNIELYKEEVA